MHLYVMDGWGVGVFTLGNLFLVDSVTNISYSLNSTSDYIFEVRALSPNNKYIVIGEYTSI